MKAWYGDGEGTLEIAARQTPGKHISETIGDLLASFGMKESILLERLRDAWPDIVTPDVARACTPVALRNETLLIEVEHVSWLSTLRQEHAATVSARVCEFAEGKVSGIRFVPGGRTRNSGKRSYPGRRTGTAIASSDKQQPPSTTQRTRNGRDRFKKRA